MSTPLTLKSLSAFKTSWYLNADSFTLTWFRSPLSVYSMPSMCMCML